MCGRYTLQTPLGVIADALAPLAVPPPLFDEWRARYNIAPSQPVPVIRHNAVGERSLGLVRWGLIPSWSRETPKHQPINARCESVATNPMFRQAFQRRRCLVPADGFYEWKKAPGTGKKQPMHVRRRGGGVFAFAGLWERWQPEQLNAAPIDTCTIITTAPNALVAPIHDRMPVVLDPADYDRWLDRDTPGSDVLQLLRPFPAEAMEAFPVSTAVNSPRNDDENCVQPLAED